MVLTAYSVYQEYLAKMLTDKYGNLSVQMDKIINDANSEIEALNQKVASRPVLNSERHRISDDESSSDASGSGSTQSREHKSCGSIP